MAFLRPPCRLVLFASALVIGSVSSLPAADDDAETKEIRTSAAQFVKAFDAAKSAEAAAHFTPKGEIIDEEGVIYKGSKEIAELFTAFFEKFPGAKLSLDIESIRTLGPNMAIEEGSRLVTAGKAGKAELRYTAVRVKVEGKWLYASLREFNNDAAPTPHELLQPLSWLVGDWMNEGSDAVVKISYKWSEDGSFLLGEYKVVVGGKEAMNSTQRIGWDPLNQRVCSWLFDADGGFGSGQWTQVEDAWIIKSSAVTPDGQTGTATLTMTPTGKDHFTIKAVDRIIGSAKEPDFEFKITRKAPAAGK